MIKITIYTHDGERGVQGEGESLTAAALDAHKRLLVADPELTIPLPWSWSARSLRKWARVHLDGAMVLISESREQGIRDIPVPD